MKYISVPIDLPALHRLEHDENISGDLIEVALSQNDLKMLLDTGIHLKLNQELDKVIDEFESESITVESELLRAKEIIDSYYEKDIPPFLPVLYNMKMCINCALRFKTGIYFFF